MPGVAVLTKVRAVFVCWRSWHLVYGVFSGGTDSISPFDSRFGKDTRVKRYNAGGAKGRLDISQAVGFLAYFKVSWKKALRCKANFFIVVTKVLVDSNSVVVLNRSKEPNIKRLQKVC